VTIPQQLRDVGVCGRGRERNGCAMAWRLDPPLAGKERARFYDWPGELLDQLDFRASNEPECAPRLPSGSSPR
jgi:hypothetical protein